MRELADAAGCALDEVYRLFGRKEAIVLALYHRLAVDLEERVVELPAGTIAERFHSIMTAKLALSVPHRKLLRSLLAAMVDHDAELGVLSPYTERIRLRVAGVFGAVVQGATDRPTSGTDRLVHTLYAMHLGLIFLWMQDQTPGQAASARAVDLAKDLLAFAGPFLNTPEAGLGRLDGIFGPLVQPPHDPAHHTLAENILRTLFRHRRLQDPSFPCAKEPCPQCFALHLPRVERFISAGEPIHLLIPGFPAKSANREKTLGPLPDMGEELALRFLQSVCDSIQELYPPGARITICSDGRVFSDLVGVSDADVTAYNAAIVDLLKRLGTTMIDVFDMDEVLSVRGPSSVVTGATDDGQLTTDYSSLRERLCQQYAERLDALKERVRNFEQHQQLYNGIHRFLFEDQVVLQPDKSRTQVRNECKELAYHVVQRSNAWSRLIAECFPHALRLSIHPQDPHAEKIGILLTEAEDNWLTPWHGVVVLDASRFKLMRRQRAAELGAVLVEREGRPSHYEMKP
jgi:pyoverdine/dityrosine biosynthesis protein Dit1/AcrR family transcriptional regulator